MQAPGFLLQGMLRGFASIRGRFSKPKPALREADGDLGEWLRSQPGLADEARQGFKGIAAGRHRKVSRRKHA